MLNGRQLVALTAAFWLLSARELLAADKTTPKTGVVFGNVVDENDKPLQGIVVAVIKSRKGESASKPDADAPATQPGLQVAGPATTDANGEFMIKDIPPGRYVVLASQKGRHGDFAIVTVGAGEEHAVALELKKNEPDSEPRIGSGRQPKEK